jgi:hypothetical protein
VEFVAECAPKRFDSTQLSLANIQMVMNFVQIVLDLGDTLSLFLKFVRSLFREFLCFISDSLNRKMNKISYIK